MGSDDDFPVRRIYTIGRNYADHAAETGLGANGGSVPGISLKPADSVQSGDGELRYPPGTDQLDPEVELVAAVDDRQFPRAFRNDVFFTGQVHE